MKKEENFDQLISDIDKEMAKVNEEEGHLDALKKQKGDEVEMPEENTEVDDVILKFSAAAKALQDAFKPAKNAPAITMMDEKSRKELVDLAKAAMESVTACFGDKEEK